MYQPNGLWVPQGNELPLSDDFDQSGSYIPWELRQQAQGHILPQQMHQFWQHDPHLNPPYVIQMYNPNIHQPHGYMANGLPYNTSVAHGPPLRPPAFGNHMYTHVRPMQQRHGVYPVNHQQFQPSVVPPPNMNQQNLPQAQPLQGEPTFLQVELGKFIGEQNLCRIFAAAMEFKIEEPYGYVKFASKDEAEAAKSKYASVFDATVGVGPTSVCLNTTPSIPVLGSANASESSREGPGSTETDGSNRETTSWPETDRPSAHIMMGWRPVLTFLSEEKKCLVEPKKFDSAVRFGTVSPSAQMVCSTPYGNRFGTGYIHYMGQAHMAGKSWAGKFKQSDLVVSNTCLCMIDKYPDSLATYLNIQKDLLALVEQWFKLYEIKGRRPAYFDDLLERMRNPPKDMGSGAYVKSLRNYVDRLVHHAGFADEKTLCLVLQEIWVNCKPKKKKEKTGSDSDSDSDSDSINSDFPTGLYPTDLEVFVSIDKLLRALYRKKDGHVTTHCEEGEYLRHLVHHINEHAEGFFSAKERVALVGWYFEKFMPRFVDVMADNKSNKEWLRELWPLYKKDDFELGAMIYNEICSMIKEAAHPRDDVVGNLAIGLGNKPGENNCFLNVTVQMLLRVKIFYERLLKINDVGSHPVLHELIHVFKALMESPQEQREAVTVSALRTALGTAYPDEHLDDGSEHEVSLALKLILQSIHSAGKSCEGEESCSCTAHDVFGVDGVEWTRCPCGSASDRNKYVSLSVSIKVSSLLKSIDDRQDISFSDHVKLVLSEDEFSCADDQCQLKSRLSRTLLALPSVYSIEIEWTLEADDVGSIMNAMSSGLDLSIIYENLDQGSRTILFPVSMACFSGMHCISFILQDDEWVMFNDLKVQVIGSWSKLVKVCADGGWKPTLVFFQYAPSGSGETWEARSTAEAVSGSNDYSLCDQGK